MKSFEKLLLENKSWAQEKLSVDKDFFNRLSNIQTPEFLWIGCSDSRVPANEITNTQPGEIFVHRNVANLVVNTDLNMLSVLQYAVEVLHVKHVIVCGHYGCGGVNAAMTNKNYGLINKWIRNIKDVYRMHEDELESITDQHLKSNRLVELNVIEQTHNVAKTTIVQKSWKKHKFPSIHGWVYGINNGILKDLIKIEPGDKLQNPIYEYDFEV